MILQKRSSALEANNAIDTLRTAAELNRDDALLNGAVLEFPDYGQVVMTGDMHGHRRNFGKLQRFCALDASPVRHVILHELIHEEPDSPAAPDRSIELLLEAAQWKCDYPDQVHFLQSNHELSQLTGHEIIKAGRIVTRDFEAGLAESFGKKSSDVLEAVLEMIVSYPLAGRTQNRVFLSHSLPGDRTLDLFDPRDLDQAPTRDSLTQRGTAYALVWGRYQTASMLDQLCKTLDVDFFLCGHQPQEAGHTVLHDRMLILASEHNHGAFLPLDLRKELTIKDLERAVRPFAAIE